MQSFAAKLLSLVLVWTALVLVVSPAQAYPTLDERGQSYIQRSSTPRSTLDKRGKRATACNCKVTVGGKLQGSSYIAPVVQKALDRGIELGKKKQSAGANDYPHPYNNHEGLKFPSCKGTGLMEFPLLNKGGASRAPEADRVVYDSKENFCGCMTHQAYTVQ
ncbi:hypothetical protein PTI98_012256 [Pleurotus ostreatus]|uniref:Uncharacterized protein n=1 Tax=Pleurotus ostreatus (strain PC15) TaxID=1137138 RepID=A0A067NIK4_PLEO1|nr:hypothetical protein PTI98_012256 [Pleurotus ostreatus]KDQ23601.1 hypothetical protein PLEOSDRAFT_1108091 [Pleurotus ostreatus PC15]